MDETKNVDILIVGAGPTGLGAATRLAQANHSSWLLVDAFPEAGGLASTHATPEGFLFDIGGHVIFSHYEYFDRLLEESLGKLDDTTVWVTHQRESFVRYKGLWVPYPFQNNLCRIPPEDQVRAIVGMVDAKVAEARAGPERAPPRNFDEWFVRTMGEGLADIFMRPYNFKVWAVPPSEMQCSWLGERVAVVDTNRAISNLILQKEDQGWGPNAVFRFPMQGGTGAIWKAVAGKLPSERLLFNKELVSVDLERKIASVVDTQTGRKCEYQFKQMISTIPVDVLVNNLIQKCAIADALKASAQRLVHSSTYVIGLGFRGRHNLSTKCWLYFPEDNCPFYRATVFSNYAPGNVPDSNRELKTIRLAGSASSQSAQESTTAGAAQKGPYWSLMLEVSEHSRFKPMGDQDVLLEECIQGCIRAGLCVAEDEIVSTHCVRFEHGYPTPSLERDEALEVLLPLLSSKGVYSRGRFGSYKYEVANQDHSLVLGVETVDAILFNHEETTLLRPNVVNKSQRNVMPTWEAPKHVRPGRFHVGSDSFPTQIKPLMGMVFKDVESFFTFATALHI